MSDLSIENLRRLCLENKIIWRVHALEIRMRSRGISRSDVIYCILHGEVIEEYPQDIRGASCLILGCTVNETPLHVVVSPFDDMLYIITVYFPDEKHFEPDWKTRRRS